MMFAGERDSVKVSAGASDMINIARALVREGPYDAVERTLIEAGTIAGLTRDAMRLFEEALAKGYVQVLARHGGWRKITRRSRSAISATPETIGPMRLWETDAAPLTFSKFTFELCRWLVTQPLAGGTNFTRFVHEPVTSGDELIAYLTCALVRDKSIEHVIAAQPGIRASALAWLGFPRMLATVDGPECAPSRFDVLAKDATVAQGLELDLARRAESLEREKTLTTSPARLLAISRARASTLDAFLSACISSDRLELATFLVDSANAAIGFTSTALDKSTPLRERLEARRASGAHLRALARLATEHQKARNLSFFDEGYAGAQLVLARWEPLGQAGFARAAAAFAQLESWDGG